PDLPIADGDKGAPVYETRLQRRSRRAAPKKFPNNSTSWTHFHTKKEHRRSEPSIRRALKALESLQAVS
ncbi:MAG: hypothetical protein V5A14_06475, partial [Desulfohalobiaceae bacterium]